MTVDEGVICPRPCSTMEFSFGSANIKENTNNKKIGYGIIHVYIFPTVKVNKIVLDYTSLSMLAEIGGYTGLFLGISLMNLAPWLEKLLAKCF